MAATSELSSDLSEQEAARRLRRYGPNVLVPTPRWRAVGEWLAILADPMVLLLGVAAGIYFALDQRVDAWVLIGSLAPVLLVDALLHARAERALREVASRVRPRARVRRDGRVRLIPAEEIVPGDLLLLQEGDVVPADARVIEARELTVDESALTGESLPVVKSADGREAGQCELFAGTSLVAGAGQAVVMRTGTATEYGKIGASLAVLPPQRTPLQRQIGRLTVQLGAGAVVLCLVVAGIGYARAGNWGAALIAAISLAIAAIPEEFPTAYTIYLTLGAWTLTRQRALVRRLSQVETLGSATVICTDKTGTLTEGRLSVQEALPADGVPLRDFWLGAAFACEPRPTDVLERRILEAAAPFGVDPDFIGAAAVLVRDLPFDPAAKMMSHVWRLADGSTYLFAKGSTEGILERCALPPPAREAATHQSDRLARAGMRVLAVAQRRVVDAAPPRGELERDMQLLGFIGFSDLPRQNVPAAIQECQRAGIRVIMITGDHSLTAHAVAEAIGLRHEDDQIITGPQLADLTPEELERRMARVNIVARALPSHKLTLVRALQQQGEIVAMTGDGVNDAPALRAADIGVAMGQRGTEVARAAADIVLMDDNFGTIVAAVREGRRVGDNLHAAFRYLITFHLPILWLALLVPLLGWPLLLLPITILWLELLIHPTVALVFQAQPPAADLMDRPPRDPRAPLLTAGEWAGVVATGTAIAFGALALYGMELARGVAGREARAIATAALVLADILLTALLLSETGTRALGRNRFFWLTGAAAFGLLLVAVYTPPVTAVTGLARLRPHDWLESLVTAMLTVFGWEAVRRLGAGRRRRERRFA